MHRAFAVNSLPGTRTYHFERQRVVDRNDDIGTHLRMVQSLFKTMPAIVIEWFGKVSACSLLAPCCLHNSHARYISPYVGNFRMGYRLLLSWAGGLLDHVRPRT